MSALLPDRPYEDNADLLKALAHAVRLQILCAIKDGEHSVGDIEDVTGIGQPGLSQQLGVLRNAELVLTRREGKMIFYRVDRARIAAVSDMLDALAGTTVVRRVDEGGAGPRPSGASAAVFARVTR